MFKKLSPNFDEIFGLAAAD